MRKPTFIILILLLFAGTSCKTSKDTSDYSFFVAGHVYGAHGEWETNIGVHPPFKNK